MVDGSDRPLRLQLPVPVQHDALEQLQLESKGTPGRGEQHLVPIAPDQADWAQLRAGGRRRCLALHPLQGMHLFRHIVKRRSLTRRTGCGSSWQARFQHITDLSSVSGHASMPDNKESLPMGVCLYGGHIQWLSRLWASPEHRPTYPLGCRCWPRQSRAPATGFGPPAPAPLYSALSSLTRRTAMSAAPATSI